MIKIYKMPDRRTAVFEYDENGVGKVTVNMMDFLMDMLAKASWIPWTTEDDDRPKDRFYYLVSMRSYKTPMKAKFYKEVLPYWRIFGTTIENTECVYFSDNEITAYMELPELYKEEKNND